MIIKRLSNKNKINTQKKLNNPRSSTAIRQLISTRLQERNKKEIVEAYRNNRITIREAAKLLSADYWKVQDILAEEGIPISNLTENEIKSRTEKVKKDAF